MATFSQIIRSCVVITLVLNRLAIMSSEKQLKYARYDIYTRKLNEENIRAELYIKKSRNIIDFKFLIFIYKESKFHDTPIYSLDEILYFGHSFTALSIQKPENVIEESINAIQTHLSTLHNYTIYNPTTISIPDKLASILHTLKSKPSDITVSALKTLLEHKYNIIFTTEESKGSFSLDNLFYLKENFLNREFSKDRKSEVYSNMKKALLSFIKLKEYKEYGLKLEILLQSVFQRNGLIKRRETKKREFEENELKLVYKEPINIVRKKYKEKHFIELNELREVLLNEHAYNFTNKNFKELIKDEKSEELFKIYFNGKEVLLEAKNTSEGESESDENGCYFKVNEDNQKKVIQKHVKICNASNKQGHQEDVREGNREDYKEDNKEGIREDNKEGIREGNKEDNQKDSKENNKEDSKKSGHNKEQEEVKIYENTNIINLKSEKNSIRTYYIVWTIVGAAILIITSIVVYCFIVKGGTRRKNKEGATDVGLKRIKKYK